MRNKKQLVLLTSVIIGILVLQSVSAVGAIAPPGGRTKYYVNGVVYKSGTSTPISGATVKLYKDGLYVNTAYTTTSGAFSFSMLLLLAPEIWEVRITKTGYLPTTKYAICTDTTTNMGIVYMSLAQTTYSIHGYIIASNTSNPVPNAVVNVYKPVYEGWGYVGQDSTDQYGYFQYSFATSETITSFRVVVVATGYDDGAKTVTGTGTNFDFGNVLVFAPIQYGVYGIVMDDLTDTELPGSTVEVYGYFGEDWIYIGLAQTNSNNGYFALEFDTYTIYQGVKVIATNDGSEPGEDEKWGTGPVYNMQEVYICSFVEKYAVIVGISDYKAISDLSYCDEDATDWYNYLTGVLGYSSANVWVYGDGDTGNYPKYDGLATESNVKTAISNMIVLADYNDIICLITAGHGGYTAGSGGDVYLCMWDCGSGENGQDGKFWDYEIANELSSACTEKIFLFFDNCHSGGIGPEIMALSNAEYIYMAATCSWEGYGYDDPSHSNGAWTYWFLEAGLIGHFGSDPSTTMEACFDWALANYPHSGDDEPEEYDGSTAIFVL